MTLITIAVVLYLYIALSATVAVFHDVTLDTLQKTFQILFSWAIPYVGGIFVLHLVAVHDAKAIPITAKLWPIKFLVFTPRRKKTSPEIGWGSDDGYIRPTETSGGFDGGADGGGD